RLSGLPELDWRLSHALSDEGGEVDHEDDCVYTPPTCRIRSRGHNAMNEAQVFKLDDLSAPIGVHVLPAHEKEEGLTIADEADEVLEPSFQTRRIASRIVAKVALLAFQPKPCRRLNVLRADCKSGSIATLGALPCGICGCDEEIEVIAGHRATRD